MIDLVSINDSEILIDDLIDLRSKEFIRATFEATNLAEFGISLLNSISRLANQALAYLILFATTYLCEAEFSTLLTIKTKSRNRLNPSADIRLALSVTVRELIE